MSEVSAKTDSFVADLTRDEKREIWMRRNWETLDALAAAAGCCTSVMSRHLRSDTMPTKYHRRLVEYGMPVELLPTPADKRRGPLPWSTIKAKRRPGRPPRMQVKALQEAEAGI
jgi:hypothetical protein